LAGRPWTRLLPDRDDGAAPVPVAVPVLTTSETDDPFVAARMSITMESATADDDPLATAAAVNGAFQGGRFRVALVVDPGRATSVHLAPLSWTLPGGMTPRAMAKAVRIRRSFAGQAGRGRQVRFLIDIPITNDRELPANRDHLLSVRLRFQFGDAEHQTTRVLRWRLRSCADINWQWTGNYTGELRAAPSFPLSCYTPDWSKQQWQFDGPSLQVMKATHDSRRIRLTTERAGERLPLTFYLGMTHGRRPRRSGHRAAYPEGGRRQALAGSVADVA
jgi:hypothetical protein